MGRRIEVELTSAREDGLWTWRAAGAKQPKGDLVSTLLYDGAQVGDVVKVEAEFHLDGIEITEVFAPKKKKERTDLLEMKIRPLRDDELVTQQRAPRSERGGDRRGGRGRSRGDDDRGQRRDRGERGARGERGERSGGQRQGQKPEADRKPRPKRLRARRVHRDALLAEITEEHRPIVEQVMRDGMPGVRAAVEKQNAEAKAAGKPEIDATPILAIAERNLAKARLAEWRDRADAALADAAELDIRDLRSVVVAGGDVARDDESRALVEQIKAILDSRLESDHAEWLKDMESAVNEGRVVRGLRLSSRPVKAGAPLPTEVAAKLSQQASEALAADVMQDRWATVLDALAFSPVRGAVTPVGIPAEPKEELLAEVRRLSDRIPAIATLFGIDPASVPKSAKRRRPPRKDAKKGQPGAEAAKRNKKPSRPVPGAENQTAEKSAPAEEAPGEPQDTSAAEVVEADQTQASEAAVTEAAPASEAPASSEEAVTEEAPAATEAAPASEEAATEAAPASEEAVTEEAPAVTEEAATEAAPASDEAPAATEAAPASDEAPAATEAAAPEASADEADAEALSSDA